jgi:prefoldin subunit 5
MESKNYNFIYQNRTYYVIFNAKNNINYDNMNYIVTETKKKYNNCEIVIKLDKFLKIKIFNKSNFSSFKEFLLEITKTSNKKFKANMMFNIDISHYYVANIYTLFIIDDNNDENMIKLKIDDFKNEFIKKIIDNIAKISNITVSHESINKLIYSCMYNLHFHKLIFTIDTVLYEYLIKIIYDDKYFNKNNISTIESYDLFNFEYCDETYTFKEYLTICKNCKEYHKSFYTNDKNRCKFICSKCNFTSNTESYKEHICNVNKVLDYCNLCNYYYKITKKHIPNRGDCYHYLQLIKKFINENRLIAIKNMKSLKKVSISIENKVEFPPITNTEQEVEEGTSGVKNDALVGIKNDALGIKNDALVGIKSDALVGIKSNTSAPNNSITSNNSTVSNAYASVVSTAQVASIAQIASATVPVVSTTSTPVISTASGSVVSTTSTPTDSTASVSTDSTASVLATSASVFTTSASVFNEQNMVLNNQNNAKKEFILPNNIISYTKTNNIHKFIINLPDKNCIIKNIDKLLVNDRKEIDDKESVIDDKTLETDNKSSEINDKESSEINDKKSSEINDKESSEINDKESLEINDKTSETDDKTFETDDKSSVIDDKSSVIDDKSSVIDDKTSETDDKSINTEIDEISSEIDDIIFSDETVAKSTETVDKSMENIDKSTETVDKSMENIDKSTETVDKSMEIIAKSIQTADKSTETIDKSIKTADKSTETINQSIETADKSTETTDKLTEFNNILLKELNKIISGNINSSEELYEFIIKRDDKQINIFF